jgi:hypothetical protein
VGRALRRAGPTTLGAGTELASRAAALDAALREVEASISPLPVTGERDVPAGLSAHYETLYGTLVSDGGYGGGSAEGRPTASRFQRKADLDRQWQAVRTRLETLAAEELVRFNAEARERGLPELRLSSA